MLLHKLQLIMKNLNNDQRLKLAHKNVREMGMIASTILVIELTHIVEMRIEAIRNATDLDSANPLVNNDTIVKLLETFINPLNA